MEALGYVLIQLFKGALPWQNLYGLSISEKYRKISEVKCGITLEQLCEGCPSEFKEYLRYCRSLEFEQKPDYVYLEDLFKQRAAKEGYDFNDQIYDWVHKIQKIRTREIAIKKEVKYPGIEQNQQIAN